MQDLTDDDIKHYVRSNLEETEDFQEMSVWDPQDCQTLIEDVCQKSSGVFLWVVLVTQSLVKGLTDGEDIFELQDLLAALPNDLHRLFWKILENLDERNFPRACRLFKLQKVSLSSLTILDMSVAYDNERNVDFALQASCGSWSEKDMARRAAGGVIV